ncbi:MAG: CD0415/CD1112 family protein [Defluviitaleaceae bacterium]|nr:CD0415/CD1112 family protein [Defluviitaleaceae bacterium]
MIAFIGGIVDSIINSIREIFIGAVLNAAEGLFDTINEELIRTADTVAETPMDFSGGGPWDLVVGIAGTAGTAIQTVAGLILGFFIALELVQMLIEKNNLADLDVMNIITKWIIKSFIAILIVSNAFVIVGAIFTIGNEVITGAAIDATASIGDGLDLDAFHELLEDASLGDLVGLWFQLNIFSLIFPIVRIAIFIVIVGRFLEIFMYVVAAPIPLATMGNQEYRAMGNNYLKSLLSLAFQGLLMLIVVAVIGGMMVDVVNDFAVDTGGAGFWAILGYLVLMCFALFKTPAISKSIFGSH